VVEEKFINEIATLVKKYASQYEIKVHSPIIAQACLESAYGTSELARNAQNYFGLKHRKNRCPSAIGIYRKVGSEQNPDRTYTNSYMEWLRFPDMDACVKGYFDFTNTPTYKNLKNVTDPYKYLCNIKADGYATSLNYVDNLMNVIRKWNLTKFDIERDDKMSNSPLVSYTKLSPNHSGQRTHSIDRITPHCVVGQLTAEGIAACFPAGREASCNYGIGKDGKIALIVEEKNRSWCSSSNANDQRAVTIECASDTTHPYAMTDAVYESLINLCTDICRRNGKNTLLWFADKNKTLAYTPKSNEMVLTVHRWFANKACPGDWLYNRLGDVAKRVTNNLQGNTQKPSNTASGALYRVRKSWQDAQSQKGAFSSLANAKKCANENPGYSVFDGSGTAVYPASSSSTPSNSSMLYKVKVTVDALNIRSGAGTNYSIRGCIRDRGVYTIVAEQNGWGKLKSGAGWISLAYTQRV
jgi:hypothetical protein